MAILLGNCNAYRPIPELNGQNVRGKIVDEKGEVLIGQDLFEFDRNSNNTITDTLGNFELIFLGNNPIIQLTGFYEPLFIKISSKNFNEIILNSAIIKESRKISKFKARERKTN